jgi:hypothetical protein
VHVVDVAECRCQMCRGEHICSLFVSQTLTPLISPIRGPGPGAAFPSHSDSPPSIFSDESALLQWQGVYVHSHFACWVRMRVRWCMCMFVRSFEARCP